VARALCELRHIHTAPQTELRLTFLVCASQNRLEAQQFGSADEHLSGVRDVLEEVSVDNLEAVFREWINILK
jgi:hypothetical protein